MKRAYMKQNGVFIGYIIETVIIEGIQEYVLQWNGGRLFIKASLIVTDLD